MKPEEQARLVMDRKLGQSGWTYKSNVILIDYVKQVF